MLLVKVGVNLNTIFAPLNIGLKLELVNNCCGEILSLLQILFFFVLGVW